MLLAFCLLAGCSGDDQPDPPGSGEPVDAGAVRTTAKVSEITGALPRKERTRVTTAVTRVVDRWWDAAYLSAGGTDDPFPGFTAGAAKLARGDADIMTAAVLDGAEDAVATRRRVTLDVLAAGKRAVGVTAGVQLVLETTGDTAARFVVRGTVQLERAGAEWRIFGYRISGGPESSAPEGTGGRNESNRNESKRSKGDKS